MTETPTDLRERFYGLTVAQRLALYEPLYPEAVVLKKGGRQVCSGSKKGRLEYGNRRAFLYEVYDRLCCLCGNPIADGCATLEHPGGRGMGASKRDDSISVCLISCWACQGRKGSRSVVVGESCRECGFWVVIGGRQERECFRCNSKWTG